METRHCLGLILATPAVGAALCPFMRTQAGLLAWALGVVAATAVASGVCIHAVFAAGPLRVGELLHLDSLSAYHLGVMMVVYLLSSVYSIVYFHDADLGRRDATRYTALWLGALASMALALLSNNLGLMWVGIEATTLLTALLITVHRTPASLEAMWKYLLICSVGVAFAFMGTLLVAAAGSKAGEALVWTRLRDAVATLDVATLKLGFLFLLVGYGTKAGLAPMHSWLPDAHSQAPAPVSAIFSGFMLNSALYCILRYVPLVESATGGSGWSHRLLVAFGLISIVVAAAFIAVQHDVKRLLAYHSVEHLGIIALGVGLGGLGAFAALFHTLNHSVCKTMGFFCAGRLGQIYGTHDMRRMGGTLRSAPVWGTGLLASILALIGVAPFAIFMSELLIVKAAIDGGSILALVAFLAAGAAVFVAALRHAIAVAWGRPARETAFVPAGLLEVTLVVLPLGALLLLGLWLPGPLQRAIEEAAAVLAGGTP
ncbi:MAG: hydrogenase 4 subunit F [Planctomycetes bacterium]|nr:hydrogenase 4 subunit F [Planctomycetota bacterium]